MENIIVDEVKTDKQYLKKSEFFSFLISIFLYTNMIGMVNNFRQAYLINVLNLENSNVSLINFATGISMYFLSFFYAILIDRSKTPKGKFRPLCLMSAIPIGILTILMFVTPDFPLPIMIAYLIIIAIMNSSIVYFGNTINMVAVVMTPNIRERNKLMSFRGIFSAIGSAAPLVVVLVVGLFRKPGLIKTEGMMYIVAAIICAIAGTVSVLIGMNIIKERIVYSGKKQNPLLGFKEIIKNKYAKIVFVSEFLKGFRSIATYMGIFLAASLLGDTSKYIFFGLPTGIGTFTGMLIVNALLKKYNNKQIYIASGIYSLIINIATFFVGILFFNYPSNIFIVILFFGFLFLIGLQFGASNLLPSMVQADILEDLEVKHRKRLDASLGFVIAAGATLSGLIAGVVAPYILYGANSIIHYVPPANEIIDGVEQTVYQIQTYATKVKMLGFYTIWHGMMMLLAGVPFFFYKLVGRERELVHEEVMVVRKQIELEEQNINTL